MFETAQSICQNLYSAFLLQWTSMDEILGPGCEGWYVPVLATDPFQQQVFDLQRRLSELWGKFKCERVDSASQEKVVLILGGSGSGKTSSALSLAHSYWKVIVTDGNSFRLDEQTVLPIFISLANLNDNVSNIIEYILKKFQFSKDQDFWIRNHKRVLLILDDYDGLQKNKEWLVNIWQTESVKAVIFCRPDTFATPKHKEEFLQPLQSCKPPTKEYLIQNYNDKQMVEYINMFVVRLQNLTISTENSTQLIHMTKSSSNGTVWEDNTLEYKKWLGLTKNELSPLPQIQELGRTPFLLTILLILLPRLAKDDMTKMETLCTTEERIYSLLVREWHKFQNDKTLTKFPLLTQHCVVKWLPEYFDVYAQNLAAFVLAKYNGVLTENYELTDEETLQPNLAQPIQNKKLMKFQQKLKISNAFLDFKVSENEISMKVLRDSCLLYSYYLDAKFPQKPSLRFRFLHISFLEFFASREIFFGVRAQFNYFVQNTTRERNDLIGISYRPLLTQGENIGIVNKLVDRAKTDNAFTKLLLHIVKMSGEISSLKQMSANAITILNLSGFNFAHQDLRNVQIVGADLSHSLLGHVDLRGANLENVNMNKSWLIGSKLQGANLDNVSVGEKLLIHGQIDSEGNPCNLQISNSFLYTSNSTTVYKCDLDSGKIIQSFKTTLEFTYYTLNASNELFAWGAHLDPSGPLTRSNYLYRWESTGKRLPSLYFNCSTMVTNSDQQNLAEDKNVKIIEVPEQALRKKLFLHNKFGLLLIVRVQPTFIKYVFPCTNQISINCVPYCTSTFLHLDFCDSSGCVAVCRKLDVTIYNLRNPNHKEFVCAQFPLELTRPVVLKFRPQGDALLVAGSNAEFAYPSFYCCSTSDENIVNILEEFPKLLSPMSIQFHNQGHMFASQHIDQFQRQLLLWNICTDPLRVTPLQKIMDVDVCFLDLTAVPYVFVGDVGTEELVYYKDCSKGELNIVSVHEGNRRRVETEIRKITMCTVSPNGKMGACLLISQIDVQNHYHGTDILYFQLPRVPGSVERLIRHELFYTRATMPGIRHVTFDAREDILYAADARRNIWILVDGQVTKHLNSVISHSSLWSALVLVSTCSIRFISWQNDIKNSVDNVHLLRWFDYDANGGKVVADAQRECTDNKLLETIPTGSWIGPGEFVCDENGGWIVCASELRGDSKIDFTLRLWSTITDTYIAYPLVHVTRKDSAILTIQFVSNETFLVATNKDMFVATINNTTVIVTRSVPIVASPTAGMRVFCDCDWVVTSNVTCLLVHDFNSGQCYLKIELWFQIAGFVHIRGGHGSYIFYVWSENVDMCCVEIFTDHRWQLMWSSKSPQLLAATGCEIGRSYNTSISFQNIMHNLQGQGRAIDTALNQKYIPFADLLASYIKEEPCADKMSPIVSTNNESCKVITKDVWVLSVVVKKKVLQCNARQFIPHMWLVLEGLRNNRRFVVKAHKQHFKAGTKCSPNSSVGSSSGGIKQKDENCDHVVVSLEPMNDLEKFREFAKKCKAKQWSITEAEGMQILNSIQEDQQREDLTFNLLRKNCVEWCCSKIEMIGKKTKKSKYFGLLLPPSILLKAPS